MVNASQSQPPPASIVIPTCNRPASLDACLTRIAMQLAEIPDTIEVIVSDDSASTPARAVLGEKFPFVRWVTGPRNGPGGNRNSGARHACGRHLIFVDDDCEPQPGWLAAYLSAASDDVSGKSILVGPTRWPGGLPSLRWEAPLNEDTDCMPSCNFGIGRDVFSSVGGFDIRFNPAFEDMELQARLVASAHPLRRIGDAVVHHAPRRIPGSRQLAARWRPQVIYALDLGAPPERLFRPYLRHVAGVIVSRLTEARPQADNLLVIPTFVGEFLRVAASLRGWIQTAAAQPRSAFWAVPAHRSGVRGFGFGARNLEAAS